MRRTMKAPVGAKAARSGKKWSPGLKHGPAQTTVYALFEFATPPQRGAVMEILCSHAQIAGRV